ncbi:hypothetical protein SAMN05421679_101560 [Epilithonimonas pallida]|uniref:Uncharacterized protein n=1 Tax=Epilithonimonas pallida TaxID=373671 RepID=A0ABY1R0Q5_9FLAO|nr:hypothetical protein SAMN05421679_101560 [Epilithonimonas pallida]
MRLLHFVRNDNRLASSSSDKQKIDLIQSTNPDWKDLYDDIKDIFDATVIASDSEAISINRITNNFYYFEWYFLSQLKIRLDESFLRLLHFVRNDNNLANSSSDNCINSSKCFLSSKLISFVLGWYPNIGIVLSFKSKKHRPPSLLLLI